MTTKLEITDKIFNTICDEIIIYGTLHRAYKQSENKIDWPSYNFFRKWIKDAAQYYKDTYESANKEGAHLLIDEALEIADNTNNDTIESKKGYKYCNNEWVSRCKLQVETRLKIAALLDPERFGAALKPMERRIKLPAPTNPTLKNRLEVVYTQLEKGSLSPTEAYQITNILHLHSQVNELTTIKEEMAALKAETTKLLNFSK